MSTDGGTKSIVGLLDAVKDQLESGQHNGNVVPIFLPRERFVPTP